jgi:hypothetical protein
MVTVTTTLGKTVYFPSRTFVSVTTGWTGYKIAWKTLAHELVHVDDASRLGPLFAFAYATPQIFALLATLAIFWSKWHLLWLVALLPIPSPLRAWLELRGYAMSMAVNFWRHGAITNETRYWIEGMFTSSIYYWMLPWRAYVRKKLQEKESMIRRGAILRDPAKAYAIVYGVIGEVRGATGAKH